MKTILTLLLGMLLFSCNKDKEYKYTFTVTPNKAFYNVRVRDNGLIVKSFDSLSTTCEYTFVGPKTPVKIYYEGFYNGAKDNVHIKCTLHRDKKLIYSSGQGKSYFYGLDYDYQIMDGYKE